MGAPAGTQSECVVLFAARALASAVRPASVNGQDDEAAKVDVNA
jgi:hypothetical protein